MFLEEVLGFWIVLGAAFYGWRRLSHPKDYRMPRVIPPSNGHRR